MLYRILSLVCLLAFQQSSKPITVNAKPGAPVELSGVLRPVADSNREYPYVGEVSAKNVSTKEIVLLITRVEVSAPIQIELENGSTARPVERSTLRTDEFYFGNSLFRPASITTFELRYPPLGDGPIPEIDNSKSAGTAEVIFVQFIDGTSWGNPDGAAAALLQRKASVERLQQLLETYRQYGELGLAGELAQPSQLTVINSLQKLYANDKANLPVVVERIKGMLSAARLHETAMTTARGEHAPRRN